MTKSINLTPKEQFNALANATHIFALKEEVTPFKLIKVINGEEDTKAIAIKEDGVIIGIFTDSKSAKATLNDVINCFGEDQPFIIMHVKETKKGQSVYYAEIE